MRALACGSARPRDRGRRGGRGKGEEGGGDAASLCLQTQRGPGHVAPADNHIAAAQVHLTRDLFPNASGGARYLLVRRRTESSKTSKTRTCARDSARSKPGKTVICAQARHSPAPPFPPDLHPPPRASPSPQPLPPSLQLPWKKIPGGGHGKPLSFTFASGGTVVTLSFPSLLSSIVS